VWCTCSLICWRHGGQMFGAFLKLRPYLTYSHKWDKKLVRLSKLQVTGNIVLTLTRTAVCYGQGVYTFTAPLHLQVEMIIGICLPSLINCWVERGYVNRDGVAFQLKGKKTILLIVVCYRYLEFWVSTDELIPLIELDHFNWLELISWTAIEAFTPCQWKFIVYQTS